MKTTDDRKAAPAAVLIAGPTASGKSALALELAERIGGAVINTDSMQVYGDLHVLSARPSADEVSRAPHMLYGNVDARERYSAGRFAEDAQAALEQCREKGLVPIFTGGTGLYFKTLVEGLSPIPHVPDTVRARVEARIEADGLEAAQAALSVCDPVLSRKFPALDRQRLVRALSVFESTGRALGAWQEEKGVPILDPARTVRVFLDADRDWLYSRIDARFEQMVAAGALDEVSALVARVEDATLPAMRAHGVPHLAAHLAGHMALDEAIARSQADTRHYAKRQKTWFRHQMSGWDSLDPADKKARASWLQLARGECEAHRKETAARAAKG
ncbi:tRNA (adenosine(37)-N6)-dimethylallyltransferase MiaA [Tepidamorphus sp. 3E244]|uniref:tRNA (adenosine(37)-N6)-dimethylallyltransferase MiaA n=1 Tax=Tepidamorphus sp. 3E244 TaxID=3385498 RepID=UPI0038FC31F8